MPRTIRRYTSFSHTQLLAYVLLFCHFMKLKILHQHTELLFRLCDPYNTVHNCNKQNSVRKKKHCCHLSVNSRDFIKIVAIWIVNRTETCMRALNAARSLTATSIRSPAIALQRILKLNPSRHRNILSQLLSEPTNTSCCFVSFAQLKQINRTAIPARPPDARPAVSRPIGVFLSSDP